MCTEWREYARCCIYGCHGACFIRTEIEKCEKTESGQTCDSTIKAMRAVLALDAFCEPCAGWRDAIIEQAKKEGIEPWESPSGFADCSEK